MGLVSTLRRNEHRAAALVITFLVAAACSDGSSPAAHVTATPLPTSSPSLAPTQAPSPSTTPIERAPTDADRGRFATMHRPDGVTDIRHVAVDVDLDDVDEIVFAMVTEGHVRVEIAAWQGTTYGIESAATGAEASVIDRIMAQDITDNGRVEIGVAHSHQNRSGLDLWSVHGLDLEPVPGEGGCARNNSFGDFGARVADQGGDEALEIVGTCAGFFGFVGRSVTWHWDGTTYVASDSDAPERDD